tara:strand:- start:1811 stop:2221 length:411 start_codon:yes stop_codon:yes gene_type:complete
MRIIKFTPTEGKVIYDRLVVLGECIRQGLQGFDGEDCTFISPNGNASDEPEYNRAYSEAYDAVFEEKQLDLDVVTPLALEILVDSLDGTTFFCQLEHVLDDNDEQYSAQRKAALYRAGHRLIKKFGAYNVNFTIDF